MWVDKEKDWEKALEILEMAYSKQRAGMCKIHEVVIIR